jgi:uncharacterized protein
VEHRPTALETLGAPAVRLARRALEVSVREGAGRDPVRALSGEPVPESLKVPRGVFVTLETYPKGRLRGCIGFPLPVFPLRLAIPRAAAAAALEDPRFPPVTGRELDALTVEVSVLTIPELLEGPPENRPSQIQIGRDGLIIEAGDQSGLLLPQVAPEQGWDVLEFLEGLCEKADLPRGAWRLASTEVQRFRAEIFRERTPGGDAVGASEGSGA